MRGTMDGKSTVELPTVTVVQQESGDGKKSRVTRKHVIIGVTCAVVTAMVIAGVIVGVKFFLDSTNEIVKHTYDFKKADGESVKEDVSVDMKDNYVQYHLKDDDSEVWVIDDFNRDLRVMRVKEAAGSKCYMLPLNRSDSALPEAVLNASAPTDKIEGEQMNYDVSERAIKDKSLLGTHAQKLCDNIDAYWMMPTCNADSTELENTNEREKRAIRRLVRYCTPYRCYYYRYCSWGGCYWRYRCYRYCYYYYRYY